MVRQVPPGGPPPETGSEEGADKTAPMNAQTAGRRVPEEGTVHPPQERQDALPQQSPSAPPASGTTSPRSATPGAVATGAAAEAQTAPEAEPEAEAEPGLAPEQEQMRAQGQPPRMNLDHALADIWEADLLPLYRESRNEARRRQRLSRISAVALLALGLIAATALVLMPPFPDTSVWIPALVAFGLCAFLAALISQENQRNFNTHLKGRMMPHLAGAMGMTHQAEPATDFVDLHAVRGQRIVDSFDRVTLEDGLSGGWRGMGFRWTEAKLTAPKGGSDDGPGDNRRVAFLGIVMEVETPQEMPWILFQPTTAGRPAAEHETSHSDGVTLKRVSFDGIDLPGGYAVYARDPAAARAAIGPAFAMTLAEIAKRHGRANRPVSGFFYDNRFTLLMRYNRAFLDLDVYRVDEQGFAVACRGALEDLQMIHQVVDLLMDGPDLSIAMNADMSAGAAPDQDAGGYDPTSEPGG